MGVRLVYIQVDSGEQRRYERELPFDELERFFMAMVLSYAPYAELQVKHMEARTRSIKSLPFPYEAYRQGQRYFAGAVYKSIADRKKLFAKAPTGTGKTISTLFPAVKAMGEGHLKRLFYVTARTTTRTAAEEAMVLMGTKGLILRSVTITAKEKICFQDEVRCSSQDCPYADGYYDRINGAILDLFTQETLITRNVLEKYARKHRVCPFEMSLDAAYASDAVIGDYNYVFDPRISLKRLWEEDKRNTAILVDEAHNLVDRAREMFSAELMKAPFLELQRAYKLRSRALSEGAKAVNAAFISLRKSLGEKKSGVLREPPEELLQRLEEFAALAERELAMGSVSSVSGESQEQQLLDAYYAAQGYIRIAGTYDERYVTYMELERNDVRIKLFCRDPSALLRQMGKGYRSYIFFSATLSPLGYYRDMLGADEEDYSVSVPSPFSKEQLEVELLPLSTRYRDREGTRGPIVSLLQRILRGRSGNVLIFFPSYEYMNDVAERFREQEPGANLLVQETGMREEERERFLGAFQAERSPSVVGFAVLGGIFSEGVDLTGDRLTNVVVVGVGLPQVGTERNLIKEYFDGTGKNGFDYAYVYPGMNKVLQAGGRLIRTERDRGLLVLVDDRFLSSGYQQLLPEEWKPLKVLRSREQEARTRWFGLYE